MPKKTSIESKPKVSVNAPSTAPSAVKKARATRKASVSKAAGTVTETKTMEITVETAASAIAVEPVKTVPVQSSKVDLREEIAKMAYALWESRGRQSGSPVEDWLQAEQEVLRRLQPAGR